MTMFYTANPAGKEQLLWCAVIEQAVTDLTSGGKSDASRRTQEEARRWFVARKRNDFDVICYRAGVDPDAVHQHALKLIKTLGLLDDTETVERKPIARRIRKGLQKTRNGVVVQLFEFKGERLSVPQWAERLGISIGAVRLRLRRGLPLDTPITPRSDCRAGLKSVRTDCTPGGGQDFAKTSRDRRGSVAQDCL